MSTVLEPQNLLKRQVALAILSLTAIGATIAAILHRLQPAPYLIDLIAPLLFAIVSLLLLIRLYKKPESLPQVTYLGLLQTLFFLVLPSWFFTLQAFVSSSTTLVGSLPPITSGLFLLTTILLIFLRLDPVAPVVFHRAFQQGYRVVHSHLQDRQHL